MADQKWADEHKLDTMLDMEWENGLSGRKSIELMKEILTSRGVYPLDRDSVPEDWEDALLLRFFVGFKKNPEAAAEAFEAMLKWRADNGINDIRKKLMEGLQPDQFPRYDQVRRFYPLLKCGKDKHGCPILITLTGLIDPAKLVKAVTLEEMRLYIIYEMEHKFIKLCQLTAQTGIFYRALEVHDLKGLGMHHLATGPVGMLRKVVKEVSANYVEISDKVFILNCPFATVVRTVLRQVVPARSQHKLAVHGTIEDYESVLLERADRAQYHECLFGGALPEGLNSDEGDDMDKWPKITIPARDKKVVEHAVERGQTVLWNVCPEGLDIACSLKFVSASGSSVPVFESAERIASLQRGSFQAEEDGTLYLSLDNVYSYLKQKVVLYDFEVLAIQNLSTQSSEDLSGAAVDDDK
mmetsp:Transcript_6161/g.12160  ORF Transcript_6161/g.12160 Transcript_6161/m.12160 type:complete len:411 (-) Transcript_6161:268-1500(-)|eukprot:CAMPEP_0181307160 /NCGR_PEP_ID=MMETSP1101-20121128/10716_1 /TAXON_ID=46948 /ORGANISM="Rhodomonas abbreviata, Strain Caron Lab Isolate" /LENGTH=410 /DNA_ID=CAMNT_0023413327 /DNA_START=178 /DNA_END=1410 /DNA_ORIENTATION=+